MTKDAFVTSNVVSFPQAKRKDAPGLFIWLLSSGKVLADEGAARCFGISVKEAGGGLPIMSFLERIHSDDRPRVAQAIHDAIITGRPYQEDYRICHADGSQVTVSEFGSCFRDEAGEPSYYSGIIVPVATADITKTTAA